MKKTFTLLATVLLITTASFAQYNDHRPGDNNNAYGNNNYGYNNNNGGSYNNEMAVNNDRDNWQDHHFGEREKQLRVDQINYEYDHKISSVENSFFIGRHKKEFKIAALQAQRDSEISYVMASFNRNDHFHRYENRYDDHDRRNW